jgi:hypothetical protein
MVLQHIMVAGGCATMALMGQVPLKVLLAQTGTSTSSGEEFLWRAASSLGALGILAWYFYQTQTKTIPSKDAQIEATRVAKDLEIVAERTASDLKVKASIEAAAVEVRAERESHRMAVDKLVDELRMERESRMEIIRKCGLDNRNGNHGNHGTESS